MHKTIEKSHQLNEEIYAKVLAIERLQAQKEALENGNSLKIAELQQLKKYLSKIEENQDGLSNRNTALREKFNQLDANVKVEGDKISEEMRSFFKKLGLKVAQETAPDNLVELKIQFSENHDYHATFIYDSVTEDYDRELSFLVKMKTHSNITFDFSDFSATRTYSLPRLTKFSARDERYPRIPSQLSKQDS